MNSPTKRPPAARPGGLAVDGATWHTPTGRAPGALKDGFAGGGLGGAA
jgi:hypothetical protein